MQHAAAANLRCVAATNLHHGNSAVFENRKAKMLFSLIRMVRDYLRRRSALAEIANLDDRTLRDIGLTRARIPASWGCE
jgi:uncharacterized protein YjiS (DUF1127 family)